MLHRVVCVYFSIIFIPMINIFISVFCFVLIFVFYETGCVRLGRAYSGGFKICLNENPYFYWTLMFLFAFFGFFLIWDFFKKQP